MTVSISSEEVLDLLMFNIFPLRGYNPLEWNKGLGLCLWNITFRRSNTVLAESPSVNIKERSWEPDIVASINFAILFMGLFTIVLGRREEANYKTS